MPTIDAAHPAAADGQPAPNGEAEDAEDAVSWAGRQQPSITETAAAVTRSRQALARIAQARAANARAGDAARAEQLARWHADDHSADRADQADQVIGRHRELEGITR